LNVGTGDGIGNDIGGACNGSGSSTNSVYGDNNSIVGVVV